MIGDGTIGLLATKLFAQFRPPVLDVFGIRSAQSGLVAQAGANRSITAANQLGKDYD